MKYWYELTNYIICTSGHLVQSGDAVFETLFFYLLDYITRRTLIFDIKKKFENQVETKLSVTLHHFIPNILCGLNLLNIRRDLFYLLDYVTPNEIFQIGDRKKKKEADMVNEINHYVP